MRNLLRFQSFNESRGSDLIKRLDVPIPIVGVTKTNPVEHKILMSYFRDYSWSMYFDTEDRLFFGGGDGHQDNGVIYVTKEDIHSLMTPDDLKLEQMFYEIDDLIDDTLIEEKEFSNIESTINTYEYKSYELITITIINRNIGGLKNSAIDKVKMFVELLSDTQNIFKITTIRNNHVTDYSVNNFENIFGGTPSNPFSHISTIQIHVIFKER